MKPRWINLRNLFFFLSSTWRVLVLQFFVSHRFTRLVTQYNNQQIEVGKRGSNGEQELLVKVGRK